MTTKSKRTKREPDALRNAVEARDSWKAHAEQMQRERDAVARDCREQRDRAERAEHSRASWIEAATRYERERDAARARCRCGSYTFGQATVFERLDTLERESAALRAALARHVELANSLLQPASAAGGSR